MKWVLFSALLLSGVVVLPTTVAAQAISEAADVKPVERWLKFREVAFTGQQIVLHLRTGYQRPVIFPEPVIVPDEMKLNDAGFDVDIDIVVFSPLRHFKATPFSVIGQHTGNVYRFSVKSDQVGQRIPLEVILP